MYHYFVTTLITTANNNVTQHGVAVGSIAASQLKGTWGSPDLRLPSVLSVSSVSIGFVWDFSHCPKTCG